MNLFYRESGEGQALIILHGLFGSSDNWLTVTKSLAETHRVFLVDQRNHGRSPMASPHNYEAMAGDLKEFIEQQTLKNPIIIGHSMGGKTAMHFACKYPDLLEKLVVVDISPRYYPPHHQSILAGLASVDLANLENRNQADEQMGTVISDVGTRQFLLKNLYRNEQNEFAWRMNLDLIKSQIENIGEALPENAHFNKPTLFIRGEKSNYITDTDKPAIAKHFPDSEVVTVMGSGHWVQAEQPTGFLEVLNQFI